jgi:hypothetical protein
VLCCTNRLAEFAIRLVTICYLQSAIRTFPTPGTGTFFRASALTGKELICMNADFCNPANPEQRNLTGQKAVVISGQSESWTDLCIGLTAAVLVFAVLHWLAS